MRKIWSISVLTLSLIFAGCITINVPEEAINLPTSMPPIEEIEQAAEELFEGLQDLEVTFESETYADEASGFELEIPADWYEGATELLEEGYSTTFQSWPMSGGDGGGQTDGGGEGQPGGGVDEDGDGQIDGEGETNDPADGEAGETPDGGNEGQSEGDADPPADESTLLVEVVEWEPANDLNAFLNHWKAIWEESGASIASKREWNINQKHRAVFFVVRDAEGGVTFYFFTQLKNKYLLLTGKGDLEVLVQIARTVRLTG